MMREHYEKIALASGDKTLQSDVDALLPRVYEFTELLVHRLGVEDVGAVYPHRVTYHSAVIPCATCISEMFQFACCATFADSN